jgi:hypothetical protein
MHWGKFIDAFGKPIERTSAKAVVEEPFSTARRSATVAAEASPEAAGRGGAFDEALKLVQDLEDQNECFDGSKVEQLWFLLRTGILDRCKYALDSETSSSCGGLNASGQCPYCQSLDAIRPDWERFSALFRQLSFGSSPGRCTNDTASPMSVTSCRAPSNMQQVLRDSNDVHDASTELQERLESLLLYRDVFLAHATQVVRARLEERAALQEAIAGKRDLITKLRKRIAEIQRLGLPREPQVPLTMPKNEGTPRDAHEATASPVALDESIDDAGVAGNKSPAIGTGPLPMMHNELTLSNDDALSSGAFSLSSARSGFVSEHVRVAKTTHGDKVTSVAEITALNNLANVALQRLLGSESPSAAPTAVVCGTSPHAFNAVSADVLPVRNVLRAFTRHPEGVPISELPAMMLRETGDPVVANEIVESLLNACVLEYDENYTSVRLFSEFHLG